MAGMAVPLWALAAGGLYLLSQVSSAVSDLTEPHTLRFEATPGTVIGSRTYEFDASGPVERLEAAEMTDTVSGVSASGQTLGVDAFRYHGELRRVVVSPGLRVVRDGEDITDTPRVRVVSG